MLFANDAAINPTERKAPPAKSKLLMGLVSKSRPITGAPRPVNIIIMVTANDVVETDVSKVSISLGEKILKLMTPTEPTMTQSMQIASCKVAVILGFFIMSFT